MFWSFWRKLIHGHHRCKAILEKALTRRRVALLFASVETWQNVARKQLRPLFFTMKLLLRAQFWTAKTFFSSWRFTYFKKRKLRSVLLKLDLRWLRKLLSRVLVVWIVRVQHHRRQNSQVSRMAQNWRFKRKRRVILTWHESFQTVMN